MRKRNTKKIVLLIIVIVIVVVIGISVFVFYELKNQDNSSDGGNDIDNRNYCPENRGNGFCIELYKPVCGWFGKNIQCIRYPCAQTYSNECFACNNEKVEYWTEGECPDG